ncbi:hypothetical protein LQ327_09135 [Actinomycetospora endophytica]|uniref:Polyketide cyclase/dehydrase/lipid transport protein n=1 Tax=Actinomycetospora endophytica TaxID=2291215 RepID=A0ABS8P5L6_9PSEU|nr:hypothetical protein [Actinomycetospora endophytica]MCD2193546.1 hypothetical protein [Actinomycetospora endophytica]
MSAADSAQVVAAIAGSVSAVGTLAAAYAALRTTRSADETARRASTALGRTARPDVRVTVLMRNHSPDPAPFRVNVFNVSRRFAAANIDVWFERLDGQGKPPEPMKPVRHLEPDEHKDAGAGSLAWRWEPPSPDAIPLDWYDILAVRMRYQDESQLVTWERPAGTLRVTWTQDDEGTWKASVVYSAEAPEPVEVGRETPAQLGYWRTLGRAIKGTR